MRKSGFSVRLQSTYYRNPRQPRNWDDAVLPFALPGAILTAFRRDAI